MTNGNYFSHLNSSTNYRQGNRVTSLNPLNENEGLSHILDNGLDLEKAIDPNSALGSMRVASPSSNAFLFGDPSQETNARQGIFAHPELLNRFLYPTRDDSNNNNTSQNQNENLEKKKLQRNRKNKSARQDGKEIDVKAISGYFGSEDVEEILKKIEPDRSKHEQNLSGKKKKKKTGGVRKNKSAKSSTAEKDIEDVDVQIELDDSLTPTCEEASTKEEEMPPNAADQLPETQDEDEKMEVDEPVQDKSSSEPAIVKDEPKEDFSAVVPNKGSNSNSSTKTVQSATTNNSQPNLEDEEECKNFLRRGWSQFLDQNRGFIYMFPDSFPTSKTRKNIYRKRS